MLGPEELKGSLGRGVPLKKNVSQFATLFKTLPNVPDSFWFAYRRK